MVITGMETYLLIESIP